MKKFLGVVGVGVVAGLAVISLSHRVAPDNFYPNPQYTTGVVATSDFTELTTVSSCGTYSVCHRKTTSAMKDLVCKEYADNCQGKVEIDHFCPLALGCADDIRNLWAQPEHLFLDGEDLGFHTKDKLETYLVIQMKSGKIQPTDAQNCILKDWVDCYHKYLSGKVSGVQVEDNGDIISSN